MQTFAYLISKLLCNFYQSLDVHGKKVLSGTTTAFGLRATNLENLLKVLGSNVYPEFGSEISLVLSLHDWFTLGALAAN